MSMSLATQLAGIRASNTATIIDKSQRKKVHSVSLVYEPKEAAEQDFETIYYACIEAFRELETIDHRFGLFSNSLFSETSIRFDRLSQLPEQTAALNGTIDHFLMLISGYLHLEVAFKALEWLVRRFQIQLHNVESLVLSTLPYHASGEFVRILDIIPEPSLTELLRFLVQAKRDLQGPSRRALVRVMYSDNRLFAALNSYVVRCVQEGLDFGLQLAFWSGIDICWCLVKESAGEDAVDVLLPLVAEICPLESRPAAQIAAFSVFSVLATRYRLDESVTEAAVISIVAHWSRCQTRALSCVALLTQYAVPSYIEKPFDSSTFAQLAAALSTTSGAGDAALAAVVDFGDFAVKYGISTVNLSRNESHFGSLLALVQRTSLAASQVIVLAAAVVDFVTKQGPFAPALNEELIALVQNLTSRTGSQLTIDYDTVELALQAPVRPPEALEVGSPRRDAVHTQAERTGAKEARAGILNAAADLELSARQSFLDEPLPVSDPRLRLWIQASGCEAINTEDLEAIANVKPQAAISFYAAVASSASPALTKVKAVDLLVDAISQSGSNSDFQVLLPIILTILTDSDSRVRARGAQCIRSLREALPKKAVKPWGADFVFGAASSKLVFLKLSDLRAILEQLHAVLDECVMDSDYVVMFASNVDKARRAMWTEFLVAQAEAVNLPSVLSFCLRVLTGLKGATKHLTRVFHSWQDTATQEKWSRMCEISRFPFAHLISDLVKTVHGRDNDGLNFLLDAISTSPLLRSAAARQLVELWRNKAIEASREKDVCEVLIALADSHGDKVGPEADGEDKVEEEEDARDLLMRIVPLSDGTIYALIEGVRAVQRKDGSHLFSELDLTKRRRRRRSSGSLQLRDSASAEVLKLAQQRLRRTTLILELLERSIELRATSDPEPSPETPQLVAALFDILEELIAMDTDTRLPVLYTEELLANCMMGLVEALKARDLKLSLNSIKVDVVVSCIRGSSSPQVQNRLLLLIASLATLCPDIVLHSVMPIFTFMGANTVRLDNDYSAHVIEQTISQVIPALVAVGNMEEEIDMALMSFVAAFPHIPRHRRNRLFGALIRILGPEHSLHKLLLLMAHKYGEAVVRSRSTADAKALVHFTTLFVRSFDAVHQVKAIFYCLQFLTLPAVSDNSLENVREDFDAYPAMKALAYEFLGKTIGESDSIAGTLPLRLQIAASGDKASTDAVIEICSQMIALLLNQEDCETSPLLPYCMELLPIDQFVESISNLSLRAQESGSNSHQMLLELIRKKFAFESAESSVVTDAAGRMIDSLLSVHRKSPDAAILDAIDELIVRFGQHLPHGTELELLGAVINENLLPGVGNSDVTVSAICLINSLCQHLGARMIGYFPQIVPLLLSKLEASEGVDRTIELASLALFGGLVQRIPSFMAPLTKRLVCFALASRADQTYRQRLLELIAEKIEVTTVLRAYAESWPAAVRGGSSSLDLIFNGLSASLDQASKKQIAALAGVLTQLLLAMFMSRARREELPSISSSIDAVEARAAGFGLRLALHLNDRLFRPMFVEIVRWAFHPHEAKGHTSHSLQDRQIPAIKFVCKVFASLKSIVTVYFGYILEPVCDILQRNDEDEQYGSPSNIELRKLIYQALRISIQNDQDDFWQSSARFTMILDTLVTQLTREREANQFGGLLVKDITSLAAGSSSQNRKIINDKLAQLLQLDAPPTQKIWTIKVLSSLYTKLGDEWVANLPRLVPLIAELLDDEDDAVERETRRSLVPVIENVLGESLDRYLA